MPRSIGAARNKRTRLRSGQSLVELSLSMVLMLFLISGVVDFGRAYFSFVELNNAVSEGSHWAAAYSQCIATASDQTSGPANCLGSNSVVERVLGEDLTLDRTKFTKVCATTTTGTYENTGNNTVTLKVTYQMSFITPVIAAMFGTTFPVTVSVQEVVRGTGAPPFAPATSPMADQGGVSTTCP